MRPIYWGLACFFIGMVGYASACVFLPVGYRWQSPSPSLAEALVYLFGFLFFLSIPLSAIAEIVRWRRRKSRTTGPSISDPNLPVCSDP